MSSQPTKLGRYLSYRCRSCKEWCCNPADEPCAQEHECRGCFAVPDLDRDPDYIRRADR